MRSSHRSKSASAKFSWTWGQQKQSCPKPNTGTPRRCLHTNWAKSPLASPWKRKGRALCSEALFSKEHRGLLIKVRNDHHAAKEEPVSHQTEVTWRFPAASYGSVRCHPPAKLSYKTPGTESGHCVGRPQIRFPLSLHPLKPLKQLLIRH